MRTRKRVEDRVSCVHDRVSFDGDAQDLNRSTPRLLRFRTYTHPFRHPPAYFCSYFCRACILGPITISTLAVMSGPLRLRPMLTRLEGPCGNFQLERSPVLRLAAPGLTTLSLGDLKAYAIRWEQSDSHKNFICEGLVTGADMLQRLGSALWILPGGDHLPVHTRG